MQTGIHKKMLAKYAAKVKYATSARSVLQSFWGAVLANCVTCAKLKAAAAVAGLQKGKVELAKC